MRALAAAIALASVALAAPAWATKPPPRDPQSGPAEPPPSGDVAFEATPVLLTGRSIPTGFQEVAVRLEARAKPLRGDVEVSTRNGRTRSRSRAPFAITPGTPVTLRLPIEVAPGAEVHVALSDAAGRALPGTPPIALGYALPTSQPMLVDTSDPPRLRAALEETPVRIPTVTGGRAAYAAGDDLLVATTHVDPATGDPVFPDRAPLWSGASAVVVRSERLARLLGPELEALAGYVLAGGTLAVVVTRADDLRHPTLVALVGGDVARAEASAVTRAPLALAPAAVGPGSAAVPVDVAEAPTKAVSDALTGFAGGNLRASVYGASAAYGLGEVHLLAFDPTTAPGVDDPWVRQRMVDVARRGHARRSSVASTAPTDVEPDAASMRKLLDPNEASRWAIGAAALLLCVYAVLAGPVSFARAASKGTPLKALWRLPVAAAVAFVLVVAIGAGARGVRSRARRVAIVEAGAGVAQGSVRRWRGFFGGTSRKLEVRASDASALVASVDVDDSGTRADRLVVDRSGARLVDLAAAPWQTVVVREDGIADLGGGVSIARAGAGGAVAVNRTGRSLRSVVLVVPPRTVFYAAHLRDGERLATSASTPLGSGPGFAELQRALAPRGPYALPTRFGTAIKSIAGDDTPGLGEAWDAVETTAGNDVRWFPEDVPVLLAQIEGGEGRLADAGMKVDRDRTLLRVVGWGGAP